MKIPVFNNGAPRCRFLSFSSLPLDIKGLSPYDSGGNSILYISKTFGTCYRISSSRRVPHPDSSDLSILKTKLEVLFKNNNVSDYADWEARHLPMSYHVWLDVLTRTLEAPNYPLVKMYSLDILLYEDPMNKGFATISVEEIIKKGGILRDKNKLLTNKWDSLTVYGCHIAHMEHLVPLSKTEVDIDTWKELEKQWDLVQKIVSEHYIINDVKPANIMYRICPNKNEISVSEKILTPVKYGDKYYTPVLIDYDDWKLKEG
jgi:hypothetical protein